MEAVKLTFDCEALLDGSNVREEVFELVSARLPGDVAHLEHYHYHYNHHYHHHYHHHHHHYLIHPPGGLAPVPGHGRSEVLVDLEGLPHEPRSCLEMLPVRDNIIICHADIGRCSYLKHRIETISIELLCCCYHVLCKYFKICEETRSAS